MKHLMFDRQYQKHDDLQTATLSIKQVWQGHSRKVTPIKSGKQLLFILSEGLYLAPSSYQAIDVVVV